MSTVGESFRELHRRFIWTADIDTHNVGEHWEDSSDKFLSDPAIVIRDDCDGFALTMAGIMVKRHDIDPKKIRICVVNTEIGQRDGKAFDHAVCEYGDMVYDNRYREPYPVGWAGYEYNRHAYFINLTKWYETNVS